MIINIKRAAVVLLVITVLISGTTLIWQGRSSDAARIRKENSQQNNIIEAKGENRKENITSSISFFAEYRMERERTRGKQMELLREIINNQATEAKAREAAALRLVQISQDMENEMKAENLVKSKGYKECVVIFQHDNIMVVVQSDRLDSEQEDEVVKLISNATGTNEENIKIISKK